MLKLPKCYDDGVMTMVYRFLMSLLFKCGSHFVKDRYYLEGPIWHESYHMSTTHLSCVDARGVG
jgi:hypothetical protein